MTVAVKSRPTKAGAVLWASGAGSTLGSIAVAIPALAVVIRGRRKRRTASVRYEEAADGGEHALVLSQPGRSPVSLVADPDGGVRIVADARASRDAVREMLRDAFGWLVEVEWAEPG